ncbi:MAG: hypothetical protein Q9217_003810 [Psora testacea]
MVEMQSDANTALAQTAKMSQESLQQLQKDFVLARQAFNDQLMRDLESSSARTQSYSEKLMAKLESAFQATLSQVRSTTSAVQSEMASLSKNIKAASAVSAGLEKNVGEVFQKVAEGSAELAKVQTAQWDISRGAARDLELSLRSLQDGGVGALIKTLGEMGLQLENSHQIIAQVYDRQNDIEERMGYFSQLFHQLETKAESFSAAQTRQAEMQSRLQDKMEVDIQVTQGYLSEVASTALHLQTTVAATASKIESMAALARAFSSVLDWAALACVGFLVFLATGILTLVWKSSRKLVLAVIIVTTFIVLDLTDVLTLVDFRFSSPVTYSHIIFNDPFFRASMIFALLLFFVFICYWAGRHKRKNQTARVAFSDLPFSRAMNLGC